MPREEGEEIRGFVKDKDYSSSYSLKGKKIRVYGKVSKFSVYGNSLENLDVSHNSNLLILRCLDNNLMSLDVSKNIALTELNCTNNKLTSLDVSKNTALTKLDCRYNYNLTCIKVNQEQLNNKVYNWEKDDSANFNINCN